MDKVPIHSAVLCALSIIATQAGCEREALPLLCPGVADGEIVVTEVRGKQSGADDTDQWIELYNASGGEIALEGLQLVIQTLDGGRAARIIVRSPDVRVAAGDYAVLGHTFEGMELAEMDYGYRADMESDLYDTAAIDVISCGQLVERAIYRNLPATGTWAFSGPSVPDAAANNDEGSWCVDDIGTPGQANLECP